MKLFRIFLVLGLIASLCSCDKDDKVESESSARTVLVYLVADNSIGTDVVNNISHIEEGLKLGDLHEGTVVVYCDGGKYLRDYSSPTLFKYTIDKNGNVSARKVIYTYPEQNSCDPEVITEVIEDVAALCPAKSYGLLLGSHATGWLPVNTSKTRTFGDDDGAKIEIPELAKAIEASGIHFDYMLVDACLMSQVEVAYELRNTADYLILSPAEIMAYGFPYKNIVRHMLNTTESNKEIAVSMAKEYIDFYKSYTYKWGTIAVINGGEMEELAAETERMVENYSDRMTSVFTTAKLDEMQGRCNYGRRLSSQSDFSYSSYDLLAFARELTDDNIPLSFSTALNRTVVYRDYVNDYKLSYVNIDPDNFSGIGCYIQRAGYSNWNSYYTTLGWSAAVSGMRLY